MKDQPAFRAARPSAAFTLMEILVVVSIILVLAAIALPVYSTVMNRAYKIVALSNMKQITGALATYASQNDGDFPDENIPLGSTWVNAADPEKGAKVWYNTLPRLMGGKGVGDFANSVAGHTSYYSRENILFLPGAQYPAPATRFAKPYFAFAINTKLQRKTDKKTGLKNKAKMSQITHPSRTVAFLEVGIKGEKKAMALQVPYDDSDPKSYGKSFVTRYGGRGVVTFIDGHAEALEIKQVLSPTGVVKFPPDTDILWTPEP